MHFKGYGDLSKHYVHLRKRYSHLCKRYGYVCKTYGDLCKCYSYIRKRYGTLWHFALWNILLHHLISTLRQSYRGGADIRIMHQVISFLLWYNHSMTQTITIYVDDPIPLVEVSEAHRDACKHV